MNRRELAAAYLLGELSDSESADVDARLDTDAELRAELEAMRSLGSQLDRLPEAAWPGASEPDHVGDRSQRRRSTARWRMRRSWVPALAAAACVAAGFAAGALVWNGNEDALPGRDGAAIALAPVGDKAPGASATVSMPEPELMDLKVNRLPPSRRGEYYELWLLDPESGGLVSVASFRVAGDGRAKLRVPLPADPSAFAAFDVSRETVTGDPGHSGDSLLRGPTTS